MALSDWRHGTVLKCGQLRHVDAEKALERIDKALCELNDDYRVERMEAIRHLDIDVLPTQVFYDFMKERLGKVGGASKFPRVLKGERYEAWKEFLEERR